MSRSPVLNLARSRSYPAESLSQSILETSAPPGSANWNWSEQSGTQNGDASSTRLSRAVLCECRSYPSPSATGHPWEIPGPTGAEISAIHDGDDDYDIHRSP